MKMLRIAFTFEASTLAADYVMAVCEHPLGGFMNALTFVTDNNTGKQFYFGAPTTNELDDDVVRFRTAQDAADYRRCSLAMQSIENDLSAYNAPSECRPYALRAIEARLSQLLEERTL
jgi:hypothetical protein